MSFYEIATDVTEEISFFAGQDRAEVPRQIAFGVMPVEIPELRFVDREVAGIFGMRAELVLIPRCSSS